MIVNILGTAYELIYCSEKEMDDKEYTGECDCYRKTIKINREYYMREDVALSAMFKTIRHEITHAILHEAGLDCYTEDETLVDALAILIPKIMLVSKEVEQAYYESDKGVLEKINEKQDSLKSTCKAWDKAIEKNGYVN